MNRPSEQSTAATKLAEGTAVHSSKRRRKTNSRPPLLFIDTNIFLDFYRARNDAGISLLAKIDGLHEQTITTCQIEMEFKKNRQKVITESVCLLKPPDFNLSPPAFLSEAATVKVIKARIREVKSRVGKLKSRILSTLENPKTQDLIYRTTQRLFNNASSLNLRYDTPQFRGAWRRAIRRFLEGRPPRKMQDTSAGDAINWEWIVRCVEETNRDVIIVSRDSDYGLTHEGKGYVNNWLAEELKDRVNKQRKLILVDRLSAALKLLDVKVTQEELKSERATITSSASIQDEIHPVIAGAMHVLLNSEQMASLIATTNASGWSCDGIDVESVEINEGVITAPVTFVFSGEQDDDKPWHGRTIFGHVIVEVDGDRNVSFRAFEASVETEEVEGEAYEPEAENAGEPLH